MLLTKLCWKGWQIITMQPWWDLLEKLSYGQKGNSIVRWTFVQIQQVPIWNVPITLLSVAAVLTWQDRGILWDMGIFLSIKCLYPSLLFILRYSLESADTDQNPICISFSKLQNSWGRKLCFLMNCRYLGLPRFLLLLLLLQKTQKTNRDAFSMSTYLEILITTE